MAARLPYYKPLPNRVESMKKTIARYGSLRISHLKSLYKLAGEAATINDIDSMLEISECLNPDFTPYHDYKEGGKYYGEFNKIYNIIVDLLNEVIQ